MSSQPFIFGSEIDALASLMLQPYEIEMIDSINHFNIGRNPLKPSQRSLRGFLPLRPEYNFLSSLAHNERNPHMDL